MPDHQGSTRERVIAAATTLLDEGGEQAVTLREVGRRVGLSRSAPYRHFASKEDLMLAVAAAEMDAMAARLEHAGAMDGPPPDRLREIAKAQLAYARLHPHRYEALFRVRKPGLDPDMLEQASTRAREALLSAIRLALPGVDDDHARRAAALLFATIHGIADLRRRERLTPERWSLGEDELAAAAVSSAVGSAPVRTRRAAG
jgi:AcrR family transcriptional regulator